jgi:hypothetical protein
MGLMSSADGDGVGILVREVGADKARAIVAEAASGS